MIQIVHHSYKSLKITIFINKKSFYMKKRTEIENVQNYLPNETDFAFATQISDLTGFNDDIARIVVLYDYQIFHSNKRIVLDAEIIHINTTTNENVTNKFQSKIRDWVVTNQFYVMLRDQNGNMVLNPDYVPVEDRIEGVFYTFNQTQKYKLVPAFDYFAVGFKNNTGSNQEFFSTIILIGDEINNLFDVYGSLTPLLMALPPEVNLNPELLEMAKNDISKPSIESTTIKSK